MIVLDTNIVLDALLFNDPAAQPLKRSLDAGQIEWLATAAMRAELARVLTYPKIRPRLAFYQIAAADVLAEFDLRVRLVGAPLKASVTCRDPDDQKFIDLAVAHQATLLSKDGAVLCLAKRLLALGVHAAPALAATFTPANAAPP